MAKGTKLPVTAAVRVLRAAGIAYIERPYAYAEGNVSAGAARGLGVTEHLVVKTLVMEDEGSRPLIVLMHGDADVSTKALARAAGVKRVSPCSPGAAERHTGYRVGGISPFGTRGSLPVYAQETIFELERVFINAGHRGFLVEIASADIRRLLNPTVTELRA